MKKNITVLMVCFLLAACSSQPKDTLVNLALQATVDQNPDSRERPSPMVVKLFELKALTAFQEADFFQLYQQPEAILGDDLLAQETVTLRPGARIPYKLMMRQEGRYIAAVAAYRNIEDSTWRYYLPLELEKTQSFELEMTRNGIVRIVRITPPRTADDQQHATGGDQR